MLLTIRRLRISRVILTSSHKEICFDLILYCLFLVSACLNVSFRGFIPRFEKRELICLLLTPNNRLFEDRLIF